MWTGEKGNVATSRILWVYVKQTAVVISEVIRSLRRSESKALVEREESDAHSFLLTGRTALVYSSSSPNGCGRGAEQKK